MHGLGTKATNSAFYVLRLCCTDAAAVMFIDTLLRLRERCCCVNRDTALVSSIRYACADTLRSCVSAPH